MISGEFLRFQPLIDRALIKSTVLDEYRTALAMSLVLDGMSGNGAIEATSEREQKSPQVFSAEATALQAIKINIKSDVMKTGTPNDANNEWYRTLYLAPKRWVEEAQFNAAVQAFETQVETDELYVDDFYLGLVKGAASQMDPDSQTLEVPEDVFRYFKRRATEISEGQPPEQPSS